MPDATAVYLITGFLGSGKTTFLNRIIQAFPKNRKLMILMNEFGDIGVDGTLVEGSGLPMLEISRGSIFCVCVKTDFIRGLLDIALHTQPDVLLIEATGVADPSDLKRDLKLSVFQNRFQFQEQFCLIDAGNFQDAYDTFTSVEKQIESATVFIINKIDEADTDVIQNVKEIVGRHHANPIFYETAYADIPLGKFLANLAETDPPSEYRTEPVSKQALEAAVNNMLQDPFAAMSPPDRLLSVTYTWLGKDHSRFEEMIERLPGGIVRAKGVFKIGTETFLFSWVMGRGRFEKITPRKSMIPLMNQIVFIGPPEAIAEMEAFDFEGMLRRRPHLPA